MPVTWVPGRHRVILLFFPLRLEEEEGISWERHRPDEATALFPNGFFTEGSGCSCFLHFSVFLYLLLASPWGLLLPVGPSFVTWAITWPPDNDPSQPSPWPEGLRGSRAFYQLSTYSSPKLLSGVNKLRSMQSPKFIMRLSTAKKGFITTLRRKLRPPMFRKYIR